MNKITMPEKQEKELAIQKIISKGLQPKKNLTQHTIKLYQSLGTKCIFGDVIDCLVIAITGTILIFFFSLTFGRNAGLSISFAISPLFYMILTVITEAKEKMNSLYELKMTCKYTIKQITALRLLCFAAMGIVASSFTATGFHITLENESFLSILLVSLLGMLMTSLLVLATLIYAKKKDSYYLSCGLWFVIFLLPALLFGEVWNTFLREIHPVLMTILIGILLVIYIRGIKKLIYSKEREVIVYANS